LPRRERVPHRPIERVRTQSWCPVRSRLVAR
jgi:hypothetical protein